MGMFDWVKRVYGHQPAPKYEPPKPAPKPAPAPAPKPQPKPAPTYNDYDEDDDDIVTLFSADGEEIEFTEIAGIAYGGNFYAILQPVELLDGMDDDEALVFRVSRGPDGEDKFDIELDDDIIDAVFREYNRLLDEQL